MVGYRYSVTLQLLMTASPSSQSLQVLAVPVFVLDRMQIHSALFVIWSGVAAEHLPCCYYAMKPSQEFTHLLG